MSGANVVIKSIIINRTKRVSVWRRFNDGYLWMKVAIYPGDANVLALQMSKPDQRFKYKSGQYIFVNCAAVSPFEWYSYIFI